MKEKENNQIRLTIMVGTLLILLLVFSLDNVNAATVKKLDNIDIDSDKTVEISNDNAPKFVHTPKVYSVSKKQTKNVVKTKVGTKYKFVTRYFLPTTWKNGGRNGKTEYWYNCQSIVVKGKYIYVYTSAGYGSSKGFIIRYNTKILDKYIKGKDLSQLRKLGIAMNKGENLTKEQKRIKAGIKIGKTFTGGHGQSLAYNPKTKSLWMWQDNDHSSTNLKLMRISMKTLKPHLIYRFKAKLNNNYITPSRNLAFDKNGNFYIDKTVRTKKYPLGRSYIYSGRLQGGKVQMKLLSILENRPGTYGQALAINRKNNRIYLVSDGAIYSAPLSKLNAGTINMNDFHYTIFSTKREFQGLCFDSQGKAYLLLIRGSEILKANEIH